MTEGHSAAPELIFRDARFDDLPVLADLLADDPLGSQRETPDAEGLTAYRAAFEAIERDPNHRIIVSETDGLVVGLLQLSLIPHLTYAGGVRGQIEGVRVAETVRSRGVGGALVGYAVDQAREAGCHLVQLTTDKRRPEAIRFYETLGFQASHEGMKLHF